MNELTSNAIELDTEITAQNTEGVIFVDINAIDGENDGTSWANAYTDLQSALAAAGASNQIWVAQGTYVPTTDGNREVSFVINNGVKVYGGFAGDETALEQRNIEANPTVLSGNIGEEGQADNSYNIVDITGSTPSTVIDGFTITGGQADGNLAGISRGGGIYAEDNGSASIVNSIITNNFASDQGGGIYIGSDSSINVVNSIFTNNFASEAGGAIAGFRNASPNIVNSLFYGNESQFGGAIFTRFTDDIEVFGSTFANNSGGEADSIGLSDNSDPIIVNNSIFWNTQGRVDNHFDFSGSFSRRIIINNSIIQGDYQGEAGSEGNITEDPLYVAPENNDFRLQLTSPGINAGNNEAIANIGVNTEVANNPRIYNETVDIGAYEYGLYVNIDDVEIAEGNEGTTNAEFTATLLDTLGQPTTEEVTVNYAVADGVASAENNDFTAASGTLVFAPEESTEAITVAINGDTDQEENETYFVNLSDATGAAVIQDGQGSGIIQNDDLLGETSTVFRFFNPNVGVHFYTASEAERDAVLENNDQYDFEGPSYISAPETDDPLTGISPVYRFFNTNTGVHLYTIDEAERTFIAENLDNYSFEGISYYGYEEQQEGTIPLYRLYNPVIDAHFYTPSEGEKDAVIESLPDYELDGDGIGFYVQPIDV